MFNALESEQYGTSFGHENGTVILNAMTIAVINEVSVAAETIIVINEGLCCYRDPLCVFRTVSVVTYEGILSVNPGIFVPLMCLHPASLGDVALAQLITPLRVSFCLRTTLAASTSVTLCHLSWPRRARIRLIKMHNLAVLGPAIGQFPYTN